MLWKLYQSLQSLGDPIFEAKSLDEVSKFAHEFLGRRPKSRLRAIGWSEPSALRPSECTVIFFDGAISKPYNHYLMPRPLAGD